jgi:chemotaxis protein methyltransferase CheR
MHLSRAAFDDIRSVVHDLCGVVIADDKQYLVKSRLEPILRRQGLPAYEQLAQRLRQPGSGLLQEQVVDAITTKETSFNRDGHPFEELRRSILPSLASQLVERKTKDPAGPAKVRIWCTAVATGQEAYSVAMAVLDVLAIQSVPRLSQSDFAILASDISETALGVARQGRYSAADLARGLNVPQRERYFQLRDGAWAADPALRRLLEFRRINLVQPLPDLGTFELILCRNVLIYLDDASRRGLCRGLERALTPSGMLIIGAAESLYGVTDAFASEQVGQTVVYRKQR